jgi:hypothetical protein
LNTSLLQINNRSQSYRTRETPVKGYKMLPHFSPEATGTGRPLYEKQGFSGVKD